MGGRTEGEPLSDRISAEAYDVNRLRCQNRRCISATEDVDQLFHEIDGEPGSYRCAYCEAKLRE